MRFESTTYCILGRCSTSYQGSSAGRSAIYRIVGHSANSLFFCDGEKFTHAKVCCIIYMYIMHMYMHGECVHQHCVNKPVNKFCNVFTVTRKFTITKNTRSIVSQLSSAVEGCTEKQHRDCTYIFMKMVAYMYSALRE